MKRITESNAIEKLAVIREEFRGSVAEFEQQAESCLTCTTQGACCLDAHFVNVRLTRLETAAMIRSIDSLVPTLKNAVAERIVTVIKSYKLDEAIDAATATYACPLFEKGIGCLVHTTAKPLPCIAHACYKYEADLPPDELLDSAEIRVGRLDRRTYGEHSQALPIPVALRNAGI